MTIKAWVTCDAVIVGHWEDDCLNPVPVHIELPKCYDEQLGCVINDAAPPLPSKGEKY